MAPLVTQHPKLRYALPVPHRRLSLWRGCVWAVNPRNQIGREGNSTTVAGFDYVSKRRGVIQGGAPTAGMMIHNGVTGWSYASGSAFDRRVEWAEANSQYTWSPTGGVSIAALFRWDGAVPGADRVILTKRWARGINSGIELSVTAANRYRLSWLCGAPGADTEQTIDSVNGAESQFTKLLVGRVRYPGRADLWLNGALENSIATTGIVYDSNTVAINMFASAGAGLPVINGHIGFAALWRRPLLNEEIALLHTDPWVMWSPPVAPMALPFGGGILDGCKCGGPWLHAWSGLG